MSVDDRGKRSKRTVAFGLVFAGVLSLSGCDLSNQARGPLQLRLVDGQVQVRVCAEIDAGSIVGEFRKDRSAEWDVFWQASQGSYLAEHTVVDTSGLNLFFDDVQEGFNPPLNVDSFVTVILAGESRTFVAAFRVDAGTLQGEWTNVMDVSRDVTCDMLSHAIQG